MLERKLDARAPWTGYWLLTRRPFADERWLVMWTRLKQELRRISG